ncbi:hypothetical protein [Atlantibacter hermannii]|uniref:hypothetical protein n=1 Tax=Atlantibacter hermannii TaxID=565 RepID=UPI00289AEC0D|nr:hypothetical protein [Atlantibacter hermannii]
MEDLIVTIEGSSKGPLKAKRTLNEEDGDEFLIFENSNNYVSEGKSIADAIFLDLNGATQVEISTHDKSLGLYSLHNASSDRLVLIKIA